MKFLSIIPLALVALGIQSPFPGVLSESTKKGLRAHKNSRGKHRDLGLRTIETGTKSSSFQRPTTCSESKNVMIFGFCIMGNHDDGENGEHTLHLNGFYDQNREYKEDECTRNSLAPVTVHPGESLFVGTDEYDGDGTIEGYEVEMTPESWWDGTTCGTYDVVVSVKFKNGNGVSACWMLLEGEEPRGLDIPRCDASNYQEPDDAFTWYLEIRPEHMHVPSPPPTRSPSYSPTESYPTWGPSTKGTTHAQGVHVQGTTNFPPDWVDSLGDGCDWYAESPSRCNSFAEDYANNGHTAKTACAVCGGGVYANGKADYPTGWQDPDGDGCGWYAGHPDNCANWGHLESHEGYTATHACVVCGGGAKMVDERDWKDDHGDGCGWYEDHPGHCDEEFAWMACAICGGGEPKWDYEGWKDSAEDGCDWYVEYSTCQDHAIHTNAQGISAATACVACGGGTSEYADALQRPIQHYAQHSMTSMDQIQASESGASSSLNVAAKPNP
jgi:hypothetical protein